MSHIGIIGAGSVGSVVAKRLVAAGHRVKVANSRGPETLQEFARATGALAVDIPEVAVGVDVLMVAIPLGQTRNLPKTVVEALPEGAVIIDAGNYVPLRDGAISEIESGLPETTWVSAQLGRSVVKAFNSISDYSLEHLGKPKGSRGRIALPVAGDDARERSVAMRLVEELGFTAYDAGSLAHSWRQQVGQAAYCTDLTLDELEKIFARADPKTVTANRNGAMKILARLPTNFPKKDLVRVARLMIGLDKANPVSWFALARIGLAML